MSDALPPETSELLASIAQAVLSRGLSPDELARIAGFAADATTRCSARRCRACAPCELGGRPATYASLGGTACPMGAPISSAIG
ncbi:MAG: hypothetical protein ABJC62_02990 [Frankiaceae bacterium]